MLGKENSGDYPMRPLRWLAVVTGVVIVLAVGWVIWAGRGAGEVPGVYVVAGARSYLAVEHRTPGGLTIAGSGSQIFLDSVEEIADLSLDVHYSNGHMYLTQVETNEAGPETWVGTLHLDLVPSTTLPGDWDLVDGSYEVWSYRRMDLGSDKLRFLENAIQPIVNIFRKPRLSIGYQFDPASPPVKSYFHRVGDPRVVDYFAARMSGGLSEDEMEAFRDVFANSSDDPYLQVHAIDAEAKHGDLEVADEYLERFRETLMSHPDRLLRKNAEMAFKSVWKAQNRLEGNDLRALLESLTNDNLNLSQEIGVLKSLLEYDRLPTSTLPVVHPWNQPQSQMVPYHNVQVTGKVALVVAMLDLFRGRWEESLELLAGTYQLGRMQHSDGPLIQRLIGMAIEEVALSGLEILVLNACETPQDFKECQDMFQKLERTPGRETGDTLFHGEWPVPLSLMEATGGEGRINDLEVLRRHNTIETRFGLLQMAAAAKHCLAAEGDLPRCASDFSRYLPEGLPTDIFSGNALCFTDPRVEPYTLYSVGPDRKDDRAAVEYAPTNGSNSRGDIFIRIPPDRTYPFSREGVRAASAFDLLGQFTQGLPMDPFVGNGKSAALSVIDSSTRFPVRVFSFGPFGMQEDFTNAVAFKLPELEPFSFSGPFRQRSKTRLQYVFGIDVDSRAKPVSFTVSEATAEAAYPFSRIGLFGMPGSIMPSPGWREFALGPRYDPSNGTKSEGRLFVEIPD